MDLTSGGFLQWQNKSITLLGMSGVGKTRLSNLLMNNNWFHYSGDYRIGTRYLGEAILDNIKLQAMSVPFLRDLLRTDSIHINNNLSVHDLKPVSSFLGKLGNPLHGGLPLDEFKRRQALHYHAEIAAMRDVPDFISKAHDIYGYQHFINDAGGSICELDDEKTLEILAEHTLILYIKAGQHDEDVLLHRALRDPKPLYYREAFLDEQLEAYMQEKQLDYIAMIEPDDFVKWIFPKLFHSRIERYDRIAAKYGYTVSTQQVAEVSNEADFLAMIAAAIDSK